MYLISFYNIVEQHDNHEGFVMWSDGVGYQLSSIGRVLNTVWKSKREKYPQFHKYLFAHCGQYNGVVFSKSGLLYDHVRFATQEEYIEFLLSVN
jgi:hypothetical protein